MEVGISITALLSASLSSKIKKVFTVRLRPKHKHQRASLPKCCLQQRKYKYFIETDMDKDRNTFLHIKYGKSKLIPLSFLIMSDVKNISVSSLMPFSLQGLTFFKPDLSFC